MVATLVSFLVNFLDRLICLKRPAYHVQYESRPSLSNLFVSDLCYCVFIEKHSHKTLYFWRQVEVIQVDHLEKNVKMQKSITSKQNKSVRQDGGRSWNHFASVLHELPSCSTSTAHATWEMGSNPKNHCHNILFSRLKQKDNGWNVYLWELYNIIMFLSWQLIVGTHLTTVGRQCLSNVDTDLRRWYLTNIGYASMDNADGRIQ